MNKAKELRIFANEVLKELNSRENEKTYILNECVKNNNTIFFGITEKPKSDSFTTILYVNNLFERMSIVDAANELLRKFDSCDDYDSDISQITDFDKVKDKIFYCLVNNHKNRYNHAKFNLFADLSVVFRIAVDIDKNNIKSTPITDIVLANWGKTPYQIYEIAKKNTPKLLPSWTEDITNILRKHYDLQLDLQLMRLIMPMPRMKAITNSYYLYGASVLLYDGMLDKIAEEYDDDLIILPSSVHESILLPASEYRDTTNNEFVQLITDVNYNSGILRPEEILSDNPYFYDRRTKEIIIY